MRPDPALRHFAGSAATLAYFDWPGEPGAPTALLVHATGFHARVWDRVVHSLPSDWRVLAPEVRGHGRSSKDGPFELWTDYGDDLVEFVDEVALAGAIGVGHSMGGTLLCQVAAARPSAFSRLVLVDPGVNAPEYYAADRFPDLKGPEEHPAARRRADWPDWQNLHGRLKDRLPFSLWEPKVLEDYCRHGLLPKASGGGYTLACPTLVEAAIYFHSWRTSVLDSLHRIGAPTVILRARREKLEPLGQISYLTSPAWEELAAQFPQAEDVYLPEYTHFLPMQDPALVARYILRSFEASGGGGSGPFEVSKNGPIQ